MIIGIIFYIFMGICAGSATYSVKDNLIASIVVGVFWPLIAMTIVFIRLFDE